MDANINNVKKIYLFKKCTDATGNCFKKNLILQKSPWQSKDQ